MGAISASIPPAAAAAWVAPARSMAVAELALRVGGSYFGYGPGRGIVLRRRWPVAVGAAPMAAAAPLAPARGRGGRYGVCWRRRWRHRRQRGTATSGGAGGFGGGGGGGVVSPIDLSGSTGGAGGFGGGGGASAQGRRRHWRLWRWRRRRLLWHRRCGRRFRRWTRCGQLSVGWWRSRRRRRDLRPGRRIADLRRQRQRTGQQRRRRFAARTGRPQFRIGLGSGIFLQGDQTITFAPDAAHIISISDVIADMTGSHDASGQTGAGHLVLDGEGTLVLGTANTFTGGITIENGTLDLTAQRRGWLRRDRLLCGGPCGAGIQRGERTCQRDREFRHARSDHRRRLPCHQRKLQQRRAGSEQCERIDQPYGERR